MVFDKLPTQRHGVLILTANFQYGGQLEAVGPAFEFINAAARDSLSLYDAHLTPLTPGSPMRGLSRPHVVVRRQQVIFLYFEDAETRASVRRLARSESLVVYTPVAVCRGRFHMSAESRLDNFLDSVQDRLLPISEARIFPLLELPAPFPAEADIILIGRDQVLSYHPG